MSQGKKKIHVMWTMLRDAIQTLIAAKMEMLVIKQTVAASNSKFKSKLLKKLTFKEKKLTDEIIELLEALKDAGFNHLEIGGGARFAVPIKFLQEDPFLIYGEIRKVMGKKANLQALNRGINTVGLSGQPRDIIELFAKTFAKSINIVRIFDFMNDPRNLLDVAKALEKYGVIVETCVALMGLPDESYDYAHTAKYYFDRIVAFEKAGINISRICLKDASGTTPPQIIFDAIRMIRKKWGDKIYVAVHTHGSHGIATNQYMEAIRAGADQIDLSIDPLAGGIGQPDVESMRTVLLGTNYELDVDFTKIKRIRYLLEKIMAKYEIPRIALKANGNSRNCPLPGGATTTTIAQLKKMNKLYLLPKVLEELKRVIRDAGFFTSVTPGSQFYIQQALLNVLDMENGKDRYSRFAPGYREALLGYYGANPQVPNPEVVKLALQFKKDGLKVTQESPVDLCDQDEKKGIEACRNQLKEADIKKPTDNEILIVAMCGKDGLNFLLGKGNYDNPQLKAKIQLDQQKEFVHHSLNRLKSDLKEKEIAISELIKEKELIIGDELKQQKGEYEKAILLAQKELKELHTTEVERIMNQIGLLKLIGETKEEWEEYLRHVIRTLLGEPKKVKK